MRNPTQLLWRGIVLFLIGMFFYIILNLLQNQRHLPQMNSDESMVPILYTKWWLPVVCGSASALVGLIYPCLEHKLGDHHLQSQEWSRVLRCVAVFVGINEACTKVDFPSNLQLSLSLAILSVGLWWYFDRTRIGLALGVSIATLATLITQFLFYHELCVYSEREFLYVRSWLPCVVFCGGITVGNIGRQLAVNDFTGVKTHKE